MDNLPIGNLSTKEIDDRGASLFQPDTVLPPQYLETVCRKTHVEAEQKLMLAVLEDAVTCFQGTSPNETKKGEPIL